MARIAIVAEDDTVWGLSAWERTIPLLTEHEHDIVGMWRCPAVLTKMKGREIPLWYLRTFGAADFIKLTVFTLVARLSCCIKAMTGKRSLNYPDLSKRANLPFQECESPNDLTLVAWLQREKVDILLIMVSFILKGEVLTAPRLGVINKHAAALPANRGLYPYLWAVTMGTPQGVSYHKVVAGIDEGALLVQDREIPATATTSMIAFYLYVFKTFPNRTLEAVSACIDGREETPKEGIAPSYHGLPGRDDVANFRSKGGKVIRITDIFRAIDL